MQKMYFWKRFRQPIAVLTALAMLLTYVPTEANAQTEPEPGADAINYVELVNATTGTGAPLTNLEQLRDNNPATYTWWDFRNAGNFFTLDFGEDYGVKLTAVQMQARENWPKRIANGRLEASLDGIVWTEITASRAAAVSEMQTLAIAEQYQAVPYRYLKITADGDAGIFNIGELQLYGARVELANLISDVTIASNHAGDQTKAVAGDVISLDFVATEPIYHAKVSINGKSYVAESADNIHWSVQYTVGQYEFPAAISFAINYEDQNNEQGKSAIATTDGSSVQIVEPSDYIDIWTKADRFGIPKQDADGQLFDDFSYNESVWANGKNFASQIFDKQAATYSDWTGPYGNGTGTYYLVIDLGEGNAVGLDRAYILARANFPDRVNGAYLQGSADGATWTTISSKAAASANWQTLTISDKSTYRYIRIINESRWYLNMAEIKLYGKQRQTGVLFTDDLLEQVRMAEELADKADNDEVFYSEATWNRFEAALTAGLAAIADLDNGGELEQSAVDALTDELQSSMKELKQEVRILETISDEGFVHPGVGVTKQVLENLRTQIDNKAEPWYRYYQNLLQSDLAKENSSSSNSDDGIHIRQNAYNGPGVASMMEHDGKRAYTQALLYYLTGKDVYRSNALKILRVWQQLDPTKYQSYADSHIKGGIPLYNLVMAAEILRYTSSTAELRWTEEDTAKFIDNVIDPTFRTFIDFNDKFMNQHNYPLYGTIAANIFKDDRENYEKVVEWYTVNDSAPDKLMTGSIYWLFREMTEDVITGNPVAPHVQHVEMGRDLAHGEGDVTNLIVLARMLNAQGTKVDPIDGTVSEDGVSIYRFLDDRLLVGTDYFLKFSQGYDVEWTPVKTALGNDWNKDRIYPIVSDEYKGRLQYLAGWDLYYIYRYQLGYSDEELEAAAPYFVQAFKNKVPPISYFSDAGSTTGVWPVELWANDWWIYIPEAVLDEPEDAISRAVRPDVPSASKYILQLEDAYSIIDGSNEVIAGNEYIWTETEGNSSYIRTIASDNNTLLAAYQLMFINRDNTANVSFMIRTNGQAQLELKREKDMAPFKVLDLPDTKGQWKLVTFDMGQKSVSYGQFSTRTFLAYLNVVGDGATVDIDYLNINSDAPLAFEQGDAQELAVSVVAGTPWSLDLSADGNSGQAISYELQGDNMPGSALNASSGLLSWTPTAAQIGEYHNLAVATADESVSVLRLTIHVVADREAAIAQTIAEFHEDSAYELATLEQFENKLAIAQELAAAASDSEFYAALSELNKAVLALRELNPLLQDGSLDYTRSSVKTSLASGFEAYLIDDNPVSYSGDLFSKYFTMDFGLYFRVAPTSFAMQPRNIWPDRTSGAIVYGSQNGEEWVQLTDPAAYTDDMQTLEVRAEHIGEAYRYFKVSTKDTPEYYGSRNGILSLGEFRIVGERTEIPNKIASATIHTDAAPLAQHIGDNGYTQTLVRKAVPGSRIQLDITAMQPLTELQVYIAGMEANIVQTGDTAWTAAIVLSEQAAKQYASKYAEITMDYQYLDARNNNALTTGKTVKGTTDGSAVLVSDSTRRIDNVLDKATLSFNNASDNGALIGPRLFDGNTTTFVDIRNEWGSGGDVFYLFDFGAGAVQLSSVELVPRLHASLADRMVGIYVAGSNDGIHFNKLSADSNSTPNWQGLVISDRTYYRYIKIMNSNSWFGNMSELELFGNYVSDSSTIVNPPVLESAAAGDKRVSLSWTAVDEAISYSIFVGTDSELSETAYATVSGEATSYEVTGLTNDQTYYFAVAVTTDKGVSEPSAAVSAVPVADSVTPTPTPTPTPTSTPTPTPTPSGPAPTAAAAITVGGKTIDSLALSVRNGEAIVTAKDLPAAIMAGSESAAIVIPAISGANAYTLQLPAAYFDHSQQRNSLTLATQLGTVTIPRHLLSEAAAADKDGLIQITISKASNSVISASAAAAIGAASGIELSVTVAGANKEQLKLNAPLDISIPYELADGQAGRADRLAIWRLDADGQLSAVPSARYGSSVGSLLFEARYPGVYAIAFREAAFADLERVEWARKAVEALAAKGIINGVGKESFAPAAAISRADYLTLLVRMLGLEMKPGHNAIEFADVNPQAYYSEAIKIASSHGLINGTGNNRFQPEEQISRQDMMVLTVRMLQQRGKIQLDSEADLLDAYQDKGKIASYAVDSLSALVKAGLIVGDAGKLNPTNETSRAEAAVLLYRLHSLVYPVGPTGA
jgi:hypothetical protein